MKKFAVCLIAVSVAFIVLSCKPVANKPLYYEKLIAGSIDRLTSEIDTIMSSPFLEFSDRHAAFRKVSARLTPGCKTEIEKTLETLKTDPLLGFRDRMRLELSARQALFLLEKLEGLSAEPLPVIQGTDDDNFLKASAFRLDLAPEAIDRYLMFYHYSEILGTYNDDSEYRHMFEPSGRRSFIDSEVGKRGIEMFMDWWEVPAGVWNDPVLTDEQKLMSTKYSMWQNPDWGGGDHYMNEYWSWEAGFKDEDCALFTGNLMAALAAEYSITRNPRTLRRLKNIQAAFVHFDKLSFDSDDPLDTEPPDGRLQRGTKTKNLYPENEPDMMTVSWDENGKIRFSHNNSVADKVTGRERKNVSRDQYYGVLTGYYTVYMLFSRMNDRSAEEQKLLDDVVAHCRLITEYLTGPRIRFGLGMRYNLYSILEGSCANPPNLSFMGAAAFEGLEEITGMDIKSNDFGDAVFRSLLNLGALVGTLEMSEKIFKPAQTGLTALNQYLAAFFMSSMKPWQWEFVFPPEHIKNADEPRRILWRRLIAAYTLKFGTFGSPEYKAVIDEMLDPSNCPPVTLRTLYNRTEDGYVRVEPAGVGLEDFMWPLMFVCAAAQNREELGAQLNAAYAGLVQSEKIGYENTDIPRN